MSDFRDLTEEERSQAPSYFTEVYYSLADSSYHALWGNHTLYATEFKGPWFYLDTGKRVLKEHFEEEFLLISFVTQLNWATSSGRYNDKSVHWSFRSKRWNYSNHREVEFSSGESSEGSANSKESDSDQAEVSQLIESATQAVASLSSKLSQSPTPVASTPQTPQNLPGGLPVTPGPSTQLPTPLATVTVRAPSPTLANFPPLPIVPQTPHPSTSKGKQPARTTVPRASTSWSTVNPTSTAQPQVPVITAPAPPAPVAPPALVVAPMATPKILGSAPEPYDGKPEKADAFLNNLGNYYFLNGTIFDTDAKKVSTALTYFKMGTPAGEWARDKQNAAVVTHYCAQ